MELKLNQKSHSFTLPFNYYENNVATDRKTISGGSELNKYKPDYRYLIMYMHTHLSK